MNNLANDIIQAEYLTIFNQYITSYRPINLGKCRGAIFSLNNVFLILQMNQGSQIRVPYLDHAPLFTLMRVKTI